MKIIGIIARPDMTSQNNFVMVANKKLLEVIQRYNVNVMVIVPPCKDNYIDFDYEDGPKITDYDFNKMLDLIKMCNGVILQGGDEFYDFDIKVIDYLYKNDIPTLGICLGMQAMASYKGGNCVRLNNHYKIKHSIKIRRDSKLYSILKSERIMISSRHNYQVKGSCLFVNAISEDNVIEAIELKNYQFGMGVQWHPEMMLIDNDTMLPLFCKLITTSHKN